MVLAFVLSQPGNPVYPPLLAALLAGLLWQSRRRLGQFRYNTALRGARQQGGRHVARCCSDSGHPCGNVPGPQHAPDTGQLTT